MDNNEQEEYNVLVPHTYTGILLTCQLPHCVWLISSVVVLCLVSSVVVYALVLCSVVCLPC